MINHHFFEYKMVRVIKNPILSHIKTETPSLTHFDERDLMEIPMR